MTRTPEVKLAPDAISALACPACRGLLRLDAAQVICQSCMRAYPVIDGIPVLIIERAEQASAQNQRS
jgi:uncharacterized protein